jgi:hypothetical protein
MVTEAEKKAKGIESQELVERIAPILHGHEPDVQGAALADLVAIWLAGHRGYASPDGKQTMTGDDLRKEVFAHFRAAVIALTKFNMAIQDEAIAAGMMEKKTWEP